MIYRTFWMVLSILLMAVCSRGNATEVYKDPHHKGFLSSLNLGFRYSSVLQNRGIILYRGFQIDPVVAVFLFDDRLEFLGDSIGYRDFVSGDQWRLRSRLVSITDQPLFPADVDILAGKPHRRDTYEWYNRAEFFWPGYNQNYFAEIDFGFAKDLAVHRGNYFDIQTKFKLFDFRIPGIGTQLEPNFHLNIGWGDAAHNEYFYGPSDRRDGFNNLSYGLWMAFPEESDRFYPIFQITHFQVLGESRNAEFAQNNNEGWLVSLIATYGVLE